MGRRRADVFRVGSRAQARFLRQPQVGLSLGLLLASGVIGFFSAVLSNEAFISWGWRIAFIMSAGLLFVGSYIRSSVHETKDFAEAKAKMPEVKYPLLDAFKRYPKMMVASSTAWPSTPSRYSL